MKAIFRTRKGQISFELEGADAKELFRQIAAVEEVFDAEHECGLCHSKELRFRHRVVGEYQYYELHCNDCGARFEFGQRKAGGILFPRRRKKKQQLPNGGWSKYEAHPDEEEDDGHPSRPAAQASAPPTEQKQSEARKTDIGSFKTPGGMQKSFDRLGEMIIGITATPTTLPGALAVFADAFRKHGGDTGTKIFAKTIEQYKASPDFGSTQGAKVLLRELVDALGVIGGIAA
jgi:hypothetical protein